MPVQQAAVAWPAPSLQRVVGQQRHSLPLNSGVNGAGTSAASVKASCGASGKLPAAAESTAAVTEGRRRVLLPREHGSARGELADGGGAGRCWVWENGVRGGNDVEQVSIYHYSTRSAL